MRLRRRDEGPGDASAPEAGMHIEPIEMAVGARSAKPAGAPPIRAIQVVCSARCALQAARSTRDHAAIGAGPSSADAVSRIARAKMSAMASSSAES